MSNGLGNAYYQELRFWSYARSTQEIRDLRFQQLNVTQMQPYLYSYVKFMSGTAVANGHVIDYADFTLQKTVTLNSIQWITDTQLLVCPLGTFKASPLTYACYREGLVNLQLHVYHNFTHYTVTP